MSSNLGTDAKVALRYSLQASLTELAAPPLISYTNILVYCVLVQSTKQLNGAALLSLQVSLTELAAPVGRRDTHTDCTICSSKFNLIIKKVQVRLEALGH
jgi:hypothetical protein